MRNKIMFTKTFYYFFGKKKDKYKLYFYFFEFKTISVKEYFKNINILFLN